MEGLLANQSYLDISTPPPTSEGRPSKRAKLQEKPAAFTLPPTDTKMVGTPEVTHIKTIQTAKPYYPTPATEYEAAKNEYCIPALHPSCRVYPTMAHWKDLPIAKPAAPYNLDVNKAKDGSILQYVLAAAHFGAYRLYPTKDIDAPRAITETGLQALDVRLWNTPGSYGIGYITHCVTEKDVSKARRWWLNHYDMHKTISPTTPLGITPNIGPKFWNDQVISALQTGLLESGTGTVLDPTYLKENITPWTFTASLAKNEGKMCVPWGGYSIGELVTLLDNAIWILSTMFADTNTFQSIKPHFSAFTYSGILCGRLLALKDLLRDHEVAWSSHHKATPDSHRDLTLSFMIQITHLFHIFATWSKQRDTHYFNISHPCYLNRKDICLLGDMTQHHRIRQPTLWPLLDDWQKLVTQMLSNPGEACKMQSYYNKNFEVQDIFKGEKPVLPSTAKPGQKDKNKRKGRSEKDTGKCYHKPATALMARAGTSNEFKVQEWRKYLKKEGVSPVYNGATYCFYTINGGARGCCKADCKRHHVDIVKDKAKWTKPALQPFKDFLDKDETKKFFKPTEAFTTFFNELE